MYFICTAGRLEIVKPSKYSQSDVTRMWRCRLTFKRRGLYCIPSREMAAAIFLCYKARDSITAFLVRLCQTHLQLMSSLLWDIKARESVVWTKGERSE